jgi:signal transduction histidine kinase
MVASQSGQSGSGLSRRRVKDLQRALDFHTVLLAMAGHDLRQPLQVMQASVARLVRRLGTDSECEQVRRSERAIAQMTEQLDRLVDALRLHERAAAVELAPVCLEQLFANLARDHSDMARRKGLKLRVCSTRCTVFSDATLLEGVLRNLIRNAIKYTLPGGQILVGCRRRGAALHVEIYDTGIGMAPDQLSRIFNAFHRLDVKQADGLGLGLFVVKQAGDLLGHRIDVRSKPGDGSCFSVVIPAAPQSRTVVCHDHGPESATPSRRAIP